MYSLLSGFPWVYYLTYDNQSRTLTCTSYGGPATTVTWRRDGELITLNATYQQTQIVTNSSTATYQTVLTIDPSVVIVGAYNCSVENARGRSSYRVIISDDGELIPHITIKYLSSIQYKANTHSSLFVQVPAQHL